jgi:hypothetical protein
VSRRQLTAFLPAPDFDSVNVVRARWDPEAAARICAHVTVVHDLRDEQVGRLGDLTSIEAITLRVGAARCWGEPEEGTYLAVADPAGGLARVRRVLGVVEPAGSAFEPHVTLTHPATTRDADAAWSAVRSMTLDVSLTIDTLHVISWNGKRWDAVTAVPLTRADASG